MRNRIVRLGLVVVGLLLAGLASSAFAGDWDWSLYLPTNETVSFGAETWYAPTGGGETPHIKVTITRGPLIGGVFDVSAEVRTGRTDLTALRLLVANDSNSNQVIDSNEWVQVAVGTVSQQGADLVGTITGASVPAGRDAYRLEHTWSGFGNSSDDIIENGLSVE